MKQHVHGMNNKEHGIFFEQALIPLDIQNGVLLGPGQRDLSFSVTFSFLSTRPLSFFFTFVFWRHWGWGQAQGIFERSVFFSFWVVQELWALFL